MITLLLKNSFIFKWQGMISLLKEATGNVILLNQGELMRFWSCMPWDFIWVLFLLSNNPKKARFNFHHLILKLFIGVSSGLLVFMKRVNISEKFDSFMAVVL